MKIPFKLVTKCRNRVVKMVQSAGLLMTAIVVLICISSCKEITADREAEQIIVMWHNYSGAEATALKALADDFNKQNEWNIILITEYQEHLFDKVQVSQESRPDIITIQPEELPSYMALDLIGMGPEQSATIRNAQIDMLEMAQGLYEVAGVMRALPLGMQTYVMYANRDWLLDLGYPMEQASWQDLQRVACAATELQGSQIGLGIPARPASLLAFLTASGAQIVDAEGFYTFADQQGLATADVLYELIAGECAFVYSDWNIGPQRLGQSSIAMILESSTYLYEIEDAVSQGRNFYLRVSALPGPEGPGSSLWFGPGIAIIKSDSVREEKALRVLEWFYSVDTQKKWSEYTAYLPIRRSLIQDELLSSENPLRQQLLQIVLDADLVGSWVSWPLFTNRMACRASLLRAMLFIGEKDSDPRAYINTAATACNTVVQPLTQPLQSDEGQP